MPDDTLRFYFVHLYTGRGHSAANRLFRSGGEGRLSAESKAHLLKKCGESGKRLPSRPDRLDLLEQYHPSPHSEDKVFYVLNEHCENILRATWTGSIRPPRGSKVSAVIFHMHTRLDMCGNCAYALDWELREREGFGHKIIEYIRRDLNKDCRDPVYFGALVSSRQDYLVWGPSRRTLPEGPPITVSSSTSGSTT